MDSPSKNKANSALKTLLFDTPWGIAGACASNGRIRRIVLPGLPPTRIRKILGADRVKDDEPAPELIALKSFILDYMQDPQTKPTEGVVPDFSGMSESSKSVYWALYKVPPGKVVTYGKLAEMSGRPNAARAVGACMAANPLPLLIPCHRVVRADGNLGGFSGPGGVRLKKKMLRWEGVRIGNNDKVML